MILRRNLNVWIATAIKSRCKWCPQLKHWSQQRLYCILFVLLVVKRGAGKDQNVSLASTDVHVRARNRPRATIKIIPALLYTTKSFKGIGTDCIGPTVYGSRGLYSDILPDVAISVVSKTELLK